MADEWANETGGEHPQQPPKQGMSTAMKVVLVLVAIFGGFALLCCGGMMWFGWRASQAFDQDLAKVRETTAEMVEMEIPERFQPVGVFDMQDIPLMGMFMPGRMRMVFYQAGSDGNMVLMEMGRAFTEGEGNPEQQMREALEQQRGNAGTKNLDVEESSVQTREFEINGQQVPFQFAEAHDQEGQQQFRQITGRFEGKDGSTVMLMIQVPEDQYDEDEIVRMLESIP